MREEESLLTTELDRLSGYQGNILQLNLDLLLHKQRAVREEEWSPVHSTPLHIIHFENVNTFSREFVGCVIYCKRYKCFDADDL